MPELALHGSVVVTEIDDHAVLHLPWAMQSLALDPTAAAIAQCFEGGTDPDDVVADLVEVVGLDRSMAERSVGVVVEHLSAVGAIGEVGSAFTAPPFSRFPIPPSP